MAHTKKGSAAPRFQPGIKVRVKPAWLTPTSPTSPWAAGRGRSRDDRAGGRQITYLIELGPDGPSAACTRSTRSAASGTGWNSESMWLGEEDIEPDDGTPVPIEQPTAIVTPPLSEKDQDDRVRMALGLTHDDPLPEVSHETLARPTTAIWRRSLKFPFAAIRGEEEIGPYSRKRATMTVTGLLDPDEGAT